MTAELQRLERQAEPLNYRNWITCMHRNRKPCNSFLLVNMDCGCDVAQHGSLTWGNTKFCSLGLQCVSLMLDIHVMVN